MKIRHFIESPEKAAEKFITPEEAFKGDLIKESGLGEENFYKNLHKFTLALTKKRLRDSKSFDNILIELVNLLNDTQKSANMIYERLSELYGEFNPEKEKNSENMMSLAYLAMNPDNKDSKMGWEFSKGEKELLKRLGEKLKEEIEFSTEIEKEIEKIMKKNAPKTSEIAGYILGAKLIAYAGSMRKLTLFPSSTIQLLGAEKALFMHLQRGTKPPKHGILLQHHEVASAKNKGKAARTIANRLSKAVKIDYFRGKNEKD